MKRFAFIVLMLISVSQVCAAGGSGGTQGPVKKVFSANGVNADLGTGELSGVVEARLYTNQEIANMLGVSLDEYREIVASGQACLAQSQVLGYCQGDSLEFFD